MLRQARTGNSGLLVLYGAPNTMYWDGSAEGVRVGTGTPLSTCDGVTQLGLMYTACQLSRGAPGGASVTLQVRGWWSAEGRRGAVNTQPTRTHTDGSWRPQSYGVGCASTTAGA